MRAISALETPLSDFLDGFLLGRGVNKGKREGRGHSTMALQVLPVTARFSVIDPHRVMQTHAVSLTDLSERA
jgi:hypothetical protein